MPNDVSNRSWTTRAWSDAAGMAVNFIDEIVNQLIDRGSASDDVNNDYQGGDSYHHENHVDRAYSLTEAASLLDELSYHEESDTGLWQGLDPREAVSVQAAYTYGNAVTYYWSELIDEINSDSQIADALEDYANDVDGVTVDTIKAGVLQIVKEWR